MVIPPGGGSIVELSRRGGARQFDAEYAALLRQAYPRGADGTLLAFTRTFAVAHRG